MREHIEFIQAQRLPWADAGTSGFAAARIKLLSTDPDDGSFSAVLRLPSGWSRRNGPSLFDEEVYVLDGDLEINGVIYPDNAYGFMSAGTEANALKALSDTTLLYFRSGEVADALRTSAAAAQRRVGKIDLSSAEWDGDFEKLGLGALKTGARMKILREDPFSGETTYVSASIAYRIGTRAERHPIVQEFFILSGELAGELGRNAGGCLLLSSADVQAWALWIADGRRHSLSWTWRQARNALGGWAAILVPPRSHANSSRAAEASRQSVSAPAPLLIPAVIC